MEDTSVLTLFDDLFVGTAATSEDKDFLRGIYFVKTSQKMIELFMALRSADSEFMDRFMAFIEETTASFSDQEENVFSTQLAADKKQILAEIIHAYASTADSSVKETILSNLQKVNSKV